MPIVIDDFSVAEPAPEQDGPKNMWAADLDGDDVTDDDRARWAEQASPAAELDRLQRAAGLDRCADGNVCYATPFIDLF